MSFLFREQDLKKLREAYEVLDNRGFQIRFIVGKTGMGKTVLLDRFLEEMEGQDEGVLVTGCACTMVGDDYQPFKDILQEMIREVTAVQEGKKNRKEKWKKVLGTSADLLLKVAPDLIGDFVPMGGLVNSISEKILEESGLQKKVRKLKNGDGILSDVLKLADQYLEVLKLIAKQYRLIVYMDNLQWADRSSLELLQRLQIGLRHLPVMFVGCYRSTDLIYGMGEERHPLETFVTHAKVSCGDVFINLDAYGENEREEWTARLLELEQIEYDSHFLNQIYQRTGGNPLYIHELLRVMKENGNLKKNEKLDWMVVGQLDKGVCPVRIEGVVREEVAALEAVKAEVLAYAAVQGRCFWLSVLVHITDRSEMELLDWMTGELGRQRHLVYEGECFRLNGEVISSFYFSDSFLQEYLYKGLGNAKRMKLHGVVATFLEELYKERTGEVCYELAWHYEQSGEKKKALKYLDICAIRFEKEADYGRMKECVERALQLNEGDSSDWQLRRLRAIRKMSTYKAEDLLKEYESCCPVNESEIWKIELWHIRMLMGQLKQAMQLAKGLEQGTKMCGITAFWLGDFRLCVSLLSKEMGSHFYLALAEFQCGEYEIADEICRNWIETGKNEVEERLEMALLGVWLAFLDEDMEQMKENLKRISDLREIRKKCRIGLKPYWEQKQKFGKD